MWGRLVLLGGCVFCSVGLTLDTVLCVFVRGRPILSILALSILVLAVCWEFAKYSFMLRGHRWCGSAITHERRTGVMALCIGITMSIGSIMGVAHGAYRALAPTQDEIDAEQGRHIAEARAARAAEEEQRIKSEADTLLKEYQALVSLGRITQAREAHAKYETIKAQNARNTQNTDRTLDESISLVPILLGNSSKTAKPLGILALIGCVCFGVLLEAVIVGMVILSGVPANRARSRIENARSRSTSDDIEIPVTASQEEMIHEELRTGVLKPTVRNIQTRLQCGAVKATSILNSAREKGYVAEKNQGRSHVHGQTTGT